MAPHALRVPGTTSGRDRERRIRVTVLEGGGHIAEIFDKATGVNPLWTPPWRSIEPEAFDHATHPGYGGGPAESRLLSAIMGHNLCLDFFGGPSAEEEAAGLSAHGEGSIAIYEIEHDRSSLAMRARFPIAQLMVERQDFAPRTRRAHSREPSRTSPASTVRWDGRNTSHSVRRFWSAASRNFARRRRARRSSRAPSAARTISSPAPSSTGRWPPPSAADTPTCGAPRAAPASSAYTAHLMDPAQTHAYFVAHSPRHQLAFGYVWNRRDFPWLGIWEENASRAARRGTAPGSRAAWSSVCRRFRRRDAR